MAGMPGIVIRIGANTKDAIAGINKTQNRLQRFGRESRSTGARIGKGLALGVGGAAVAGVAAAAAAAVEGVQLAIEDEASQSKLAVALKGTTNATEDQVAAMEDYINTAQKKTGLDDGKLRNGMARLLRSTKDATRAQQLSETALSISLATGKDYETVANALAKANDGQTTALKKLGITTGTAADNYGDLIKATDTLTRLQGDADAALDTYGPNSSQYADAMKKVNKQLDKINTIKGNGGIKWVAELNRQFDGAIAADAATYAGKLRRVGTAWSELQEAYGGGVIGNGKDLGSNMDDLATSMYDAQPSAATFGALTADIANNLLDIANVIGPVVDKMNEIGNGWFFTSLPGLFTGENGVFNMGRRAAAQLTGNDVAAYETGYGRTPQTVRPNATGSANRPWESNPDYPIDLYRYAPRAKDAAGRGDARAAQRGARTRSRP